MNLLLTGGAGFIGYSLAKVFSKNSNFNIVIIDNLNEYYNLQLKLDRLSELGIPLNFKPWIKVKSIVFPSISFLNGDIQDHNKLEQLFNLENFDFVINLAAQAGVQYSISNPRSYIDSNIVGFFNILECCRNYGVNKLIYASSSSVYGLNQDYPFKESDRVDTPISLYAASKRCNELMAFTYSHLYNFRSVGLRFFTVYGPWGRPDMAPFIFTSKILNDEQITVFNNGLSTRDFTYIDDVTSAIDLILNSKFLDSEPLASIYNVGNSHPVTLLKFLNILEKVLNKKAIIKFESLQPGDVMNTFADVSLLNDRFSFNPSVALEDGLDNFVTWYNNYYY